jgi:hypothetical protein
MVRLDNGTERGRHRLYGNRRRVCGVATETLRTDRVYDAKEAREETVVFEAAQTFS